MTQRAILLLGSNIGERTEFIKLAVKMIKQNIGAVELLSHMYETEPWGFECPQWFVNQAISVKTNLSSEQLLNTVHIIEHELGRQRMEGNRSYAPRSIDIDILFYGQEVIETPFLTIPHPEIENRKFALLPLMDIAPNYVHPLSHKTVLDMYKDCPDNSIVNILNTESKATAYEV
ncbi:MAG: 2-amino-4-hydroxy-6-hydroxymethyldihydropteridine diphosphokinase [Bacteroidales bacterium]|nr:2-amino-4-hydroxy-6-hydroxymethyldihydropteridine diphosphokinase [Bacteroidales bacterium]